MVEIKGKITGFTLIELLTVIIVVGILVSVAAPAFTRFVESNRLTALTNDLVADINFARSEAIKRSARTGLCATSGSNCATSTNWGSAGWTVFLDSDNSSTWTTGDTVVKTHDPSPANNTVTSDQNFLIFDKIGGLVSATSSVVVCNSRINQQRAVSVGTTGRATITPGIC